MAQVFNNVLISGLRGRIGNQLMFRVVNGVTIVSRSPGKPDRRKESEAQRNTRLTFRAASRWAKTQLANPDSKRYYTMLAKRWNLTNAYTAAVKFYMGNNNNLLETAMTDEATNRLPQHRAASACTQDRARHGRLLSHSVLSTNETINRLAITAVVESMYGVVRNTAVAAFRNYVDQYGPSDKRERKINRARVQPLTMQCVWTP